MDATRESSKKDGKIRTMLRGLPTQYVMSCYLICEMNKRLHEARETRVAIDAQQQQAIYNLVRKYRTDKAFTWNNNHPRRYCFHFGKHVHFRMECPVLDGGKENYSKGDVRPKKRRYKQPKVGNAAPELKSYFSRMDTTMTRNDGIEEIESSKLVLLVTWQNIPSYKPSWDFRLRCLFPENRYHDLPRIWCLGLEEPSLSTRWLM